MKRRASGLLLHISSLPSAYGIGDMGPNAHAFVDTLCEARQAYWQILPMTPVELGAGNSPYRSSSAFAGNPLFISPESMHECGLLTAEEISNPPAFEEHRTQYERVAQYKADLFSIAFERFKSDPSLRATFKAFEAEHAAWLDDYALFSALKIRFGGQAWFQWPRDLRDRNVSALDAMRSELGEEIYKQKFLQFEFFRQWNLLRRTCKEKGVLLIGDMPIYVAYDSADLWANPGQFKLDEEKRPRFVAGVPPDYFSATGQLWGDPVYDWDAVRQTGYAWWIRRLEQSLKVCDVVRIDHFRAFSAYWEIPAGEETAINGRWVDGPGADFFRALLRKFPFLPIIAEDLGLITPDVRELISTFDLPGMKVLLFAFDQSLPQNPYAPHNIVENCVVYTGTHDNNTVRGWAENDASWEDLNRLGRYIGQTVSPHDLPLHMVRLALASVANLAIIPVQDILSLGAEARMNTPGIALGNWEWRLTPEQYHSLPLGYLRELMWMYGRD
jgi:4-alpha-glucanotransferase